MPPKATIFIAVLVVVNTESVSPAHGASKSDTLWYNKEWKKVSSRQPASYFRIAPVKTDTGYRVADYYVNGSPYLQGYSNSPDEELKTGYYVHYDSLGKRTSEGSYIKGLRNGRWAYYYGGGKRLSSELFFDKDLIHGISRDYDSATGKLRLEGEWAMGNKTGIWKQYYTGTDRTYRIGTYKFGERDGEFKTFQMDGRLKRLDYYEAGRLTQAGKCFDEMGKQVAYSPYYQEPGYQGDLQDLVERMAKKAGFRKRKPFPDHTWFYFTITRNGQAKDLELVDPKSSISAYIPWLVNKMDRWRPMQVDGHFIKCRVTCFIRIDESGAYIRPEFAPAEDFLSPLYPGQENE